MQYNSYKKTGFTLAEVLVTLGIIGVVSAMTLPTLTKNHQRTVYTTQLHKVYNVLSQAGDAYITSKNAVNLKEAGVSSQNGIRDFVQSQFKTVKSYGSSFSDCFASEYKNMNGAVITNYWGSNCFSLSDGASICMEYSNGVGAIDDGDPLTANKLVQEYSGGIVAKTIVDINGKQGPNILGRDLFFIAMYNDGMAGTAKPREMCTPSDNDCHEKWNRGSLQKCQQATDMNTQDASFCFAQLENDGWKMQY